MKKMNKRTITFALSLILCLAVSIGIATAYFTDYEAARGGATLQLSGQTQLEESIEGNKKIVVIRNVDETDMIVRVKPIGDGLDIDAASGWIAGADGWYYWHQTLKGSKIEAERGETAPLTVSVTVADEEVLQEVIVVHEASRTVFDGDTLVCPNGWDSNVVSQIEVL